MALESLDIIRRSATTTPSPQERKQFEVAKLIDVSKCIGCKACQSACQEWNDLREEVGINAGSYQNPPDLTADSWTLMRFTETEQNGTLEWLIRKDGCMHCQDPGCLKACPSPGAIVQYSNGIVDFHQENCIGCGYCIAGCPFNVPRISKNDSKAYKCTLCSDRIAVGLEPSCIKACPTQALVFGSKSDMIDHANERVAELKERGFENAGLYDPQGVGGDSCNVCSPACGCTRTLFGVTGGTPHQSDGRTLEGGHEAPGSRGHGPDGPEWPPPLSGRRPE